MAATSRAEKMRRKVKGQGHKVIKRTSGVGMQINKTAYIFSY